jgi:hypothetical protein
VDRIIPFHLPLVDRCLEPHGSGYLVPVYAQRVKVVIVEDLSVACELWIVWLWVCRDLPSKELFFVIELVITDALHRSTSVLGAQCEKCAEEKYHLCSYQQQSCGKARSLGKGHTLDGAELEVGPQDQLIPSAPSPAQVETGANPDDLQKV